jgi:uncharacterized surface protein with fasciclin (FAS1) repeats
MSSSFAERPLRFFAKIAGSGFDESTGRASNRVSATVLRFRIQRTIDEESVMKVRTLCALACAIALFAVSSARAEEKDIIDTAVGAGQFKTLATALKAAGLVETLKGDGPFTVFAPTDEAFAKIPEEKLKAVLADKKLLTKILMAHVVAKKSVMAKDVMGLDGKKVNGFTIKIDDGKVSLGEASVIKADIKCSNGVIHVIDTVLIPTK